MSDENYFDAAALVKLRQLGGDNFVRRMIDLFFEYAPQRLGAARAGAQAGDLGAIARGVHPLKSSAGQLGARRVAELAAQIEKLAIAQEATAILPLIEELEAAVAQINLRLEPERKSAAP